MDVEKLELGYKFLKEIILIKVYYFMLSGPNPLRYQKSYHIITFLYSFKKYILIMFHNRHGCKANDIDVFKYGWFKLSYFKYDNILFIYVYGNQNIGYN